MGIADKYEVTWSSLFVNGWKDGKENVNNMTEFSFSNARNEYTVTVFYILTYKTYCRYISS